MLSDKPFVLRPCIASSFSLPSRWHTKRCVIQTFSLRTATIFGLPRRRRRPRLTRPRTRLACTSRRAGRARTPHARLVARQRTSRSATTPYTPNAQRHTPNATRRMPLATRQTPNAKRQTSNAQCPALQLQLQLTPRPLCLSRLFIKRLSFSSSPLFL